MQLSNKSSLLRHHVTSFSPLPPLLQQSVSSMGPHLKQYFSHRISLLEETWMGEEPHNDGQMCSKKTKTFQQSVGLKSYLER